GAHPKGDLTIEGITSKIRNGLNVQAGDFFGVPLRQGSQILIRRNAAVAKSAGGLRVLFGNSGDTLSRIRFSENLVAANTAHGSAMSVRVFAGGPAVEIVNNTVVSNTGSEAVGIE